MSIESIAVVGVGPIGTGEHGRGIPAVAALLEELSADCRITVYSLLHATPNSGSAAIRVRALPIRTPWLRLDMYLLCGLILFDHLRCRIDLLHALDAHPCGHICAALARLIKARCIVTMLGEELSNLEDPKHGRVPNAAERDRTAKVCEKADVVAMLTRFQARGLDAMAITPRRKAVVPLGVDTARFQFGAQKLGPPFGFLHVAYEHPVKGTQLVLETFAAVAAHVDARLVVIGSGHAGGSTARRIEVMSLTDRVRLLEPLPNAELAAHYRAAHFLLHASWYESQCVAFNEAMACGTVVCSSNVGLAADLGADFCVLSEPGQVDVLARQILSLLRNEHRYRELQSNALNWCRAHDVRWTAAEYRRIYRGSQG